MDAKEKAKELIDNYAPLVTIWDCYWDAPENPDNILRDAKQCALIAVDEIIEEARDYGDDNHRHDRLIFWEDVKKEINN